MAHGWTATGSILLGVLLLGGVFRDIWHTIFHPEGHGQLGARLVRGVWALFRRSSRSNPRRLRIAGPAAMLAVLSTWLGALALGWALLYLPFLPGAFVFDSGIAPEQKQGFFTALYLSCVTLATLGYGDIVPQAGWLRLAAALEAFSGFAVLTASLSWVMSVHRIIRKRCTLALRLALLGAEPPEVSTELAAVILRGQTLSALTDDLLEERVNLQQFPVTYYFRENDERESLAVQLPVALRLAERFDTSAPLCARARLLREATVLLLEALGHCSGHEPEHQRPEQLLQRYREEHLR